MEEITSVNNILVKETQKLLQKKYRDSEKKFILEGYKALEEALHAGINIEYIFVEKGKENRYKDFEVRLILTNSAVLKKISAADTAPEVVGVAHKKTFSKKDFKNLNKIILLENIKDLGNLGTIIRTAKAFNADGIVLYGNCADMYNPKCVRASVGNLWKLPIIYLEKLDDLKELFGDYQRIATLPLAKNILSKFNPKEKILIMFGSEAEGLSNELIDFATDTIKIEMNENVESLNLAVSCAVVMYKLLL